MSVAEKKPSAMTQFNHHLDKMKEQMGLVLPRHMTADRMARLALTAFGREPKLQECTFQSIAASVLIAAQMGLEIGVGGQGWLIPYGKEATFVPGWQGLVELLNRSGRATAWTGAVFQGDSFDFELGDSPYLKHKPIGGKIGVPLFTYAIGRVKEMDWPIIEVWTKDAVEQHRERYNKLGRKHYSYANDNNWEMYARKVALLQVLKYLPKSVELQAAVDASYAADSGSAYTIDANFSVTPEPGPAQSEVDADALTEELNAKKAARDAKQKPAATNGKSASVSVPADEDSEASGNGEAPESDDVGSKIVADYLSQIGSCESLEDCRALGLAIKGSKSLDAEEKAYLTKQMSRRAQEVQNG